MACSCKHGNESLGSIKDEILLTALETFWFFKIILLQEVNLIFNPENHSLHGSFIQKLMQFWLQAPLHMKWLMRYDTWDKHSIPYGYRFSICRAKFVWITKLFLFIRKNCKFKLRLFHKITNDILAGYKTEQHTFT
jgi:hypothetical protein